MIYILTGVICDTLAARVEVVNWPTAVRACFCGCTLVVPPQRNDLMQ